MRKELLYFLLIFSLFLSIRQAIMAQWATPSPPPPTATPTPTAIPTPTPYPTVAVSGLLKEYSGLSCSNDISSNSLSINISPQFPPGVTPSCGVTPPTGATKSSYRCTVVFDNQGAAPTPAQNLNLNASASEYQSAYWTDNNACSSTANNTIAVDVAAPAPTTVFNKDVFFQTTRAWIKLKNGTYMSGGALTNVIPQTISSYDADDSGGRYFIINDANVVPGLVSANPFNTGTAPVSSRGWSSASYTKQAALTSSTFLEYVKSRKLYQTVTVTTPPNLDLSTITTTGIYYVGSSVTLTGDPGANMVLIVGGDVTINQNFNREAATDQPKKSVAILANTINLDPTVAYAYGVFVANTVATGSTTTGLKIKGNLSAGTFNNQRAATDNTKPSVFIIFDQNAYLNLLPYLSIDKYEWQQLQ
jgi:hypothetical protein